MKSRDDMQQDLFFELQMLMLFDHSFVALLLVMNSVLYFA